jgi:probable O-glycosylation ligase (exosortase A-associated)
MVLGPGDSIIGANNAIGLALNMVLPFCWYLGLQEKGWLRRILLATFFLTIPAIMFTYSRASALTAGVVVLAIIMKHRFRILMLVSILIVGVLAVPFLPEKWMNRQRSTLNYEDDGSAMSRIDGWKLCWRVAMDRPLTGAGFDFQSKETFAKYAPEFLYTYRGKVWDTHNIYFSMLACHGFIGLAVFLILIVSCLMSCMKLKRQSRRHPELKWMGTYCDIVQISFLAFLVNGFFVNMEYFDLVYHLISIIVILKEISYRTMLKSEETAPSFDNSMPSPVTA